MNRYERNSLLGSGAYGTVWLVKSKLSKAFYVLKEVELASMKKDDKKRAFLEVSMLSACNHENIIRYKEYFIDDKIGRLHIVMEYADNGDLHSAITKQNGVPFSEDMVIFWFIQICLALQYLHYRNILHRDLKPRNIFLTKNKSVKIGDFGISRILHDGENFATTSIGTPYYLSPEIVKKRPYNQKSDMWALGCILFELSALEHPFRADNLAQLVNYILHCQRKELPSWSSSLIEELVTKLLNIDPIARSSVDEILRCSSLQPHLSKYLSNHKSRKNASFLVSSHKLATEKLLRNTTEHFTRQRAASTINAPSYKERVGLPPKDATQNVDKRLTSTSRLTPAKRRKMSSQSEIKVKQYEVTYFKPSKKQEKLQDSPKNKVTMNVTYIVSDSSKEQELEQSPEESKSEENIISSGIDNGYQSGDTNSGGSSKKTMCKQHWFPDHSENLKKSSAVPGRESELAFRDSKSPENDSNWTEISFTHCPHGQCHQCLLDLLWKNRIRGSVEDSINVKEYNKLKNKLLLVYQGDLFKKIYKSFLQDWEEKEIRAANLSIKNLMKNLNYDQVQNLPLMMQLIQLDLLMKPKDKTSF